MDPYLLAVDPHQRIAKVDLQPPHPGGVANRTVARACAFSSRRHAPLDMPQADHHAVLGRQLLANDVSVAVMPEEARSPASRSSNADRHPGRRYGADPPLRR